MRPKALSPAFFPSYFGPEARNWSPRRACSHIQSGNQRKIGGIPATRVRGTSRKVWKYILWYLCYIRRIGVAQTVFLVARVFVPCQEGVVLTKTAKMTNLHSIHWKSEPIFGKGMRRSTFHWKKGLFSEKGGGNSVNEGFGKDFYRIGTFGEEVWAIQWTTGLWKLKSCCPHPLPENQLLENKGFGPQTPENDENDKNGGVSLRQRRDLERAGFALPWQKYASLLLSEMGGIMLGQGCFRALFWRTIYFHLKWV